MKNKYLVLTHDYREYIMGFCFSIDIIKNISLLLKTIYCILIDEKGDEKCRN
jgi:hypothetical protein